MSFRQQNYMLFGTFLKFSKGVLRLRVRDLGTSDLDDGIVFDGVFVCNERLDFGDLSEFLDRHIYSFSTHLSSDGPLVLIYLA